MRRLARDLPEDVAREAGCPLPREGRGPLSSRGAKPFTQLFISQGMLQRDLDRAHVLRVDQQGGVARELRKRASIARHARHPMRHRLQQREAEALVQARESKRSGGFIEGAERSIVHVSQVANAWLGLDAIERVTVGPAGATRDHEGWRAASSLAELLIGLQKARVVLAR